MLMNRQDACQSRTILAFDSSCLACSRIARGIEEVSHGRLTARSLRDPEVATWLRQELGEAHAWEPALIKLEGGNVSVWTGRAMSWKLLRMVGVRNALAIVRMVRDGSVSHAGATSPSRRRFLKGAVGTGITAAVLAVGISPFKTSAHVASRMKDIEAILNKQQ